MPNILSLHTLIGHFIQESVTQRSYDRSFHTTASEPSLKKGKTQSNAFNFNTTDYWDDPYGKRKRHQIKWKPNFKNSNQGETTPDRKYPRENDSVYCYNWNIKIICFFLNFHSSLRDQQSFCMSAGVCYIWRNLCWNDICFKSVKI